MNRRSFLTALGLAPVAAVVPAPTIGLNAPSSPPDTFPYPGGVRDGRYWFVGNVSGQLGAPVYRLDDGRYSLVAPTTGTVLAVGVIGMVDLTRPYTGPYLLSDERWFARVYGEGRS